MNKQFNWEWLCEHIRNHAGCTEVLNMDEVVLYKAANVVVSDMDMTGFARNFRGLSQVDGGLIVLIDGSGGGLSESNSLKKMAVVSNPFTTAR